MSIDFARRAFPDSQVGGGTPHFFAQLNRLEGLGVVDFVTFTTSPIVHGADDDSVMLSLQSLLSMIDTLRALGITSPIRVGPSSIAVRKSPLGGQPTTDGTAASQWLIRIHAATAFLAPPGLSDTSRNSA